jgi:predicted nucleic acid-binding Zn ribbon protein
MQNVRKPGEASGYSIESSGDASAGMVEPRGAVGAAQYPPRYDARMRYGARSDLTLIKSILAKALQHKGLDEKVERYAFILHWSEIVGEALAKISKPDHISRRVLLVTVAHSAWAQELTFMKPSLLQKLKPYLRKGDFIEDIVFRVGQI